MAEPTADPVPDEPAAAPTVAAVGDPGRLDRLLLVLAAWQLVLHASFAVHARDPEMVPTHAVAFLHDLLLLLVTRGALGALDVLPIRTGRFVRVTTAFAPLVLGALLALYPQILREYLAFPVNVFATGGGSAKTMLTQYLGLSRLWPSAMAALLLVFAWRAEFRPAVPRRVAWGLVSLVLAVGLFTSPRSPNPLVHSVSLQASEWMARRPRVVPSLDRPPAREDVPPPRTPALVGPGALLLADHVFLIVLESVTADDFEREFLRIPDGFASRTAGNGAYFAGYRTTNQDSYTALIAMLTGEFVPYRAYAKPALYERVNTAPNLVRTLRGLGYRSTFVSTYAFQPYVPVRDDWDRIVDRTHLPAPEAFVSAGTARMEQATEDLAALGTVVEAARGAPKSVVMHELVYGHSGEWKAKTGVDTLAYYNHYLCDLLDGIVAAGIASRSLVVVVSDHGDRAKSDVAANYRVPLYVTGVHVRPLDDASFRTHLDLPRLVASFLTGTPLPPPRTELHVVGSTERWIYGTLLANGSHVFIDDAHGSVLSKAGGVVPTLERAKFQAVLDRFGRRFGP